MRKKPQQGPFLDRTGPLPEPPKGLKAHGRDLWASIMGEYSIRDSGGLAMLHQACTALDRAEQCAAAIARDGATVTNASGSLRDHPLLKHEQAARSFVVKTLRSLGLNFEPKRNGPGRPELTYYGDTEEDFDGRDAPHSN